ncbi:MAG: DUF167 domain-containing protein [Candidatus Pacebacteria bacterium]|nr:DUF167 domain-containing protein [Candidatus Paceibacterota bacterium]MDD5722005.1 DUF167 domain-containing protein [Candidatus Paceibacterota bacterium]
MLIKVKVISRARKQGVVKKAIDSYEIRVKARPLHGEANKEAKEVLSQYFEIPERQIKIIKGHRQTNKIFSVPLSLESNKNKVVK